MNGVILISLYTDVAYLFKKPNSILSYCLSYKNKSFYPL